MELLQNFIMKILYDGNSLIENIDHRSIEL